MLWYVKLGRSIKGAFPGIFCYTSIFVNFNSTQTCVENHKPLRLFYAVLDTPKAA